MLGSAVSTEGFTGDYYKFFTRCNRIEVETPSAMITLDMWLPPSKDVDSWGLVDAGQLGPAVR